MSSTGYQGVAGVRQMAGLGLRFAVIALALQMLTLSFTWGGASAAPHVSSVPSPLYQELVNRGKEPVNMLEKRLRGYDIQAARRLNRNALGVVKLSASQREGISQLLRLYAVHPATDEQMLSINTVLEHLHDEAGQGHKYAIKILHQLGAPGFSGQPPELGVAGHVLGKLGSLLDRASLGIISGLGKTRCRESLKAADGYIEAATFRRQQLQNLTIYPPANDSQLWQQSSQEKQPESAVSPQAASRGKLVTGLLTAGLVGAGFLVNSAQGMSPPPERVRLHPSVPGGSGGLITSCDVHCTTGDCPLAMEVSRNNTSVCSYLPDYHSAADGTEVLCDPSGPEGGGVFYSDPIPGGIRLNYRQSAVNREPLTLTCRSGSCSDSSTLPAWSQEKRPDASAARTRAGGMSSQSQNKRQASHSTVNPPTAKTNQQSQSVVSFSPNITCITLPGPVDCSVGSGSLVYEVSGSTSNHVFNNPAQSATTIRGVRLSPLYVNAANGVVQNSAGRSEYTQQQLPAPPPVIVTCSSFSDLGDFKSYRYVEKNLPGSPTLTLRQDGYPHEVRVSYSGVSNDQLLTSANFGNPSLGWQITGYNQAGDTVLDRQGDLTETSFGVPLEEYGAAPVAVNYRQWNHCDQGSEPVYTQDSPLSGYNWNARPYRTEEVSDGGQSVTSGWLLTLSLPSMSGGISQLSWNGEGSLPDGSSPSFQRGTSSQWKFAANLNPGVYLLNLQTCADMSCQPPVGNLTGPLAIYVPGPNQRPEASTALCAEGDCTPPNNVVFTVNHTHSGEVNVSVNVGSDDAQFMTYRFGQGNTSVYAALPEATRIDLSWRLEGDHSSQPLLERQEEFIIPGPSLSSVPPSLPAPSFNSEIRQQPAGTGYPLPPTISLRPEPEGLSSGAVGGIVAGTAAAAIGVAAATVAVVVTVVRYLKRKIWYSVTPKDGGEVNAGVQMSSMPVVNKK